jgi:hypothetical protein
VDQSKTATSLPPTDPNGRRYRRPQRSPALERALEGAMADAKQGNAF